MCTFTHTSAGFGNSYFRDPPSPPCNPWSSLTRWTDKHAAAEIQSRATTEPQSIPGQQRKRGARVQHPDITTEL